MPTDEQLNNVRSQVASLEEARYEIRSATSAIPHFADPPLDARSWADLNEEQRIGVLSANVVWWGFAEGQDEKAMRAIAAGEADWDRGIWESIYEPSIRAANDNAEEIER